jgi:N-acetyltransferase
VIEKALILEGERVRLEPLAFAHTNALRESCADPALWEYTFSTNPFLTDEDARRWTTDAIDRSDTVAFAVVEKASEKIIGSTRYFEIVPAYRKLEIGWTFLAREFWRTHVNTEMKYLMFRYAFESWNAMRVQLKAEARNQRSRAAILRLGATYEGTHRNYRLHPDGSRRDVSYYSVIDTEWPIVKERLLSFMHAEAA